MVPGFGIGETADDRIGTCELHLLQDVVGRDVVIHIAEVCLRQRVLEQTDLLHRLLVVLIGELSVQVHGIGILHHLACEHDGL